MAKRKNKIAALVDDAMAILTGFNPFKRADGPADVAVYEEPNSQFTAAEQSRITRKTDTL